MEGLDSTTLLFLLRQQGPVEALHVSYGQPSEEAERKAIGALCECLNISLLQVQMRGFDISPGEVVGRNALFVHAALAVLKGQVTIVLGIHSGSGYVDCEPDFVKVMQESLDYHTGGSVVLAAPFLTWSKGDIQKLAVKLDVPVNLTYSCEASNSPCKVCPSCLDRARYEREE